MKRILFLLLTVPLLSASVSAGQDEFGNVNPKPVPVKPRHDLAFTIGTPGILNLSYTVPFNRKFGARITGGGIPGKDAYFIGGQLEVFYVLGHSQDFSYDLSLGYGGMQLNLNGDDDADDEDGFNLNTGWLSYWIAAGNFRYRRFVAQGGVIVLTDISSSETVVVGGIVQVGLILFRF